MKKKRKSKAIKDLYLDRPTSHGGWPGGHEGGYTDKDTPVYKQIANYLKSMGLADDDNPRARLSESMDKGLTMYEPLKLQGLNKAIYGLVRAIHETKSAKRLGSHGLQIIFLITQFVQMEAPLTEKQSWYLSSAILMYYQKMEAYKADLKDEFEKNRHKTGNYFGSFFDSPDMDKWREIDAKQLEFHREVESMIGVWERQGMPDMYHLTVRATDIDDLRSKFVAAGLASSNDGTFTGPYGRPPTNMEKYGLYSNAFYHGEERYFINEHRISAIIRESIKRLL